MLPRAASAELIPTATESWLRFRPGASWVRWRPMAAPSGSPSMARRPLVMAALLLLVLSCCTPTSAVSPKAGPRIPHGGVLRVVMSAWNGSELSNIPPGAGALDPQLSAGVTFFDSAELFRCCLLRTLYSNVGRPAREGGAELHPDLAVALPDVSTDGLTWTFRIRQGVKYAPPIQREIVATDFVRALQRQARLSSRQTRIYSVIAGSRQS